MHLRAPLRRERQRREQRGRVCGELAVELGAAQHGIGLVERDEHHASEAEPTLLHVGA